MAGILAVLIVFFLLVYLIRRILDLDGDADDMSTYRTPANPMIAFVDMGDMRGRTLQEISRLRKQWKAWEKKRRSYGLLFRMLRLTWSS